MRTAIALVGITAAALGACTNETAGKRADAAVRRDGAVDAALVIGADTGADDSGLETDVGRDALIDADPAEDVVRADGTADAAVEADAAAQVPVIEGVVAVPGCPVAGDPFVLRAVVHDPAGGALGYSWRSGAVTSTEAQPTFESSPEEGACAVQISLAVTSAESGLEAERTLEVPTRAAEDFDRNGVVDDADLALLQEEFGRDNCATTLCLADLDRDGRVGAVDFNRFLAAYGTDGCACPNTIRITSRSATCIVGEGTSTITVGAAASPEHTLGYQWSSAASGTIESDGATATFTPKGAPPRCEHEVSVLVSAGPAYTPTRWTAKVVHLVADVVPDGKVDAADLQSIVDSVGRSDCCDGSAHCLQDLDGDCEVDANDLVVAARQNGCGCAE